MKPVNKACKRFLDHVTTLAGRKLVIDNNAAFMALHVVKMAPTVYGVYRGVERWSLYHKSPIGCYDPKIDFLHSNGEWYPYAVTQWCGVQLGYSLDSDVLWPEIQADIAAFCKLWFANIKQQQGIKVPRLAHPCPTCGKPGDNGGFCAHCQNEDAIRATDYKIP